MTLKLDVVTTNFDMSIFDAGGELPPEVREEILRILALNTIAAIQFRVFDGVSLAGGPFAKYKDAYRKWKAKKGRAPETDGDWLTFTGQMLASMTIAELDPEHFVVGFSGNRIDGISNSLLAWVNHQTRPFVGLTEQEKEEIVQQTFDHAEAQGLI